MKIINSGNSFDRVLRYHYFAVSSFGLLKEEKADEGRDNECA